MSAETNPYNPCRFGLHVCGVDEEANLFTTEANFHTGNEAAARVMFERAKAECACPEEESTLVVDLMIDDDIVEDFWMSRQMLGRLAALYQMVKS